MANGKSGRSKRVNPLATIIGIVILVVASFFGIEFSEEIPTVTTVEQKGTQPIQDIEGQLVVHMIDVGQADCFLLVQDGVTALVDCGTRSTGKDAVAYLQQTGISSL